MINDTIFGKKLEEAVAAAPWKEAGEKYKDWAPHEYIVREWAPDLFKHLESLIVKYGKRRRFKFGNGEKIYRVLFVGKYRYWVLGHILNRTNRGNPPWYLGDLE